MSRNNWPKMHLHLFLPDKILCQVPVANVLFYHVLGHSYCPRVTWKWIHQSMEKRGHHLICPYGSILNISKYKALFVCVFVCVRVFVCSCHIRFLKNVLDQSLCLLLGLLLPAYLFVLYAHPHLICLFIQFVPHQPEPLFVC